MKRLIQFLCLTCLVAASLGLTQQTIRTDTVVVSGVRRKTSVSVMTGSIAAHIHALQQSRQGSLIQCRGKVEISTDTMLLSADEVDYDLNTAEAEARGNVRVKLLLPTH